MATPCRASYPARSDCHVHLTVSAIDRLALAQAPFALRRCPEPARHARGRNHHRTCRSGPWKFYGPTVCSFTSPPMHFRMARPARQRRRVSAPLPSCPSLTAPPWSSSLSWPPSALSRSWSRIGFRSMPLPMLKISPNEPTSSGRSLSSRDGPPRAADGLGLAADHHPGLRRAQAAPAPRHRRDDHHHPGRAAIAAAGSAAAGDGRGTAVVRALAAVLAAPNEQIAVLEKQVDTHFSPHPDAEIILSRTGNGTRTRPPVKSSGSRPTTARTRGPAD
jgi:hypothetical protein